MYRRLYFVPARKGSEEGQSDSLKVGATSQLFNNESSFNYQCLFPLSESVDDGAVFQCATQRTYHTANSANEEAIPEEQWKNIHPPHKRVSPFKKSPRTMSLSLIRNVQKAQWQWQN